MRKKTIIPILYLVLVCAVCLFLLRYPIGTAINRHYEPDAADLSLSVEDRLSDFYSVYDTVVSSVPALDEFARRYGVDFKAKKEYYAAMVRDAETDYEFYLTMTAIMQDIPSFHTDVVMPEDIHTLHCYGSARLMADREVLAKNKYWENVITEATQSSQFDFLAFRYVDGAYMLDTGNISPLPGAAEADACVVFRINGQAPEEYLTQGITLYNYHYDTEHDMPYKGLLVFNYQSGVPVSIELEDEMGHHVVVEAYYSLRAEDCFAHRYASVQEEEALAYEGDSFSYVWIPDMLNAHGNDVLSLLNSIHNDCVILDLRGNYGGNVDFAGKYIYPALFSNELNTSTQWHMPSSETNAMVYRNIFDRLFLDIQRDDEYFSDAGVKGYCGTAFNTYKGELAEDKQVIILIDTFTGSAADWFVSDMKAANKAVIIGENSGGEGLMRTFLATHMPHSGLVYTYMPSEAKNPDGTSNAVYGTAPDIYAQLSREDYLGTSTTEDLSFACPPQFQYDTIWKTAAAYAENAADVNTMIGQ